MNTTQQQHNAEVRDIGLAFMERLLLEMWASKDKEMICGDYIPLSNVDINTCILPLNKVLA